MDNHRPEESILHQEDFSPYNRFRRRQHRRVWLRREDGSEMELDSPFLFPELATAAETVMEPEAPSSSATAALPAIPDGVVRQWGTREQMAAQIEKLTYAALPKLGNKAVSAMSKTEKSAFSSMWERLRKKLLDTRRTLITGGFIPPLSGKEEVPFGFVKATYRPKNGTAYTGTGSSSKLLQSERADKVIARLHASRRFPLTQDQLDIIQRMANVESGGRIQVLNAYDGGLVSFGFLQLTLHVGKLQALIQMAPDAFKKYGIALDPSVKYTFGSTEKHPAIAGVSNANRSQLRWNGWAERFYYAGFDPDIIEAQVQYAIKYLGTQLAALKRRLKLKYPNTYTTIYNTFYNNYYQQNAYIRGLFQESFNNNPARSVNAVAASVTKFAGSHPTPAAWLEKYKSTLVSKGWERLVNETAKGASVQLSNPQPVQELEYEDLADEADELEVWDETYEMEEDNENFEDGFAGEMDDEEEHEENEYEPEPELETDPEAESDDDGELYDEGEEELEDAYADEFETGEEEAEYLTSDIPEDQETGDLLAESEEYEEEEDGELTDDELEDDEYLLPGPAYEYETASSAKGTTAYLDVSAVRGHKRKTGAFVPDTFKPSSAVNILVYLHGLYKRGDEANGIAAYWKQYANIPELFYSSGKNAILLAPTLGSNPQSSLVMFNRAGFFDKFIEACLTALKAKNLLPQEAEPGSIIIAGHSAGGKPMSGILHAKNKLLANIGECWGFDCLYGYYFDGWLQQDRQKHLLYHYWAHNAAGAKSRPAINGDALQKRHPNMRNIAPKARTNHQSIIAYAWKNEINQRPWFDGAPAQHQEYEAPAALKLVKLPLYTSPITIVKANKKSKLAELREAPSVYLKAIVKAAGEDPDKWFSSFTQVTFLGRKLKPGQYVHVSLARLLQKTEAKFMEQYPGKSATAIGDALGLTQEGMAASRGTSATATYSYHMFGLALDINYNGNPYIQPGAHAAFNQFMKKVGLLNSGTAIPVISWDAWASNSLKPDDYMRLYDQFAVLDKHLERYFSYLENPAALQARLDATQNGYWYGKTLAQATAVIKKDLKDLTNAWKGSRKNPEAIFRKGGFLALSRAFVEGMVKAGFDWGGRYGDMMHFDMRTTGVGAKIETAKNAYISKKRKEAAAKYLALV
ncbi:M15 family metallopeptidase [Chitinophaga alhagiae]|uniref:M15 family metallopeptidase n=1 Tax=Chitinophaga alhagiae TaxID=2203219 RepID=UPI000E5A4A7B|nr:M15 family metallopeptidase [Chitinophaga alhagiae]